MTEKARIEAKAPVAAIESGEDVPYRDLADWCVKVMRKAGERRGREQEAS